MWVTEVDPHDEAAVADAMERLRAAEAFRRMVLED